MKKFNSTLMYFLILIMSIIILSTNCVANNNSSATKSQNEIDVLMISGDVYGSSFVVGDDNIRSIKQQFEDFGWNITIAGIGDTIGPCPWGESTFNIEPLIASIKINEINSITDFDAVVILPGRDFSRLITDNTILNLLKEANNNGMIIAAWCRGVRLLAAADIIRGKNVIGHFDYFEDYKEAGANYVEYSFKWENGNKIFENVTPPVRDRNIITTVRSLYYRNEMCKLIKEAVEETLIGDK